MAWSTVGAESVSLDVERLRVVIVDPDDTYLFVLRSHLNATGSLDVQGQSMDALRALRVAARLRPDIVVLGLHPFDADVILASSVFRRLLPDALLVLHAGRPTAPMLASMQTDPRIVFLPKGPINEVVKGLIQLSLNSSRPPAFQTPDAVEREANQLPGAAAMPG